ncbi:Fis family transcriptional regulator [Thalassobacillus sp. CUG 92003]|uniref:Fis family transcriptional regulator n=1 Tax=Thalassobacillus sp. CUG 92003 TaxID=2736641 RepID=UPI0015E7A00D|nr:Fis family transcriptional regulator [Thalassobacillus sp. CUG 92003]
MTKRLPLTKGKFTLVDDEDFDWLNENSWYFEDTGCGYVCRRKKVGYRQYKKVYMHREIMKAKENTEVDHVNRSGLDNRKKNLRFTDRSKNMFNTGVKTNNTSGYKGVSRCGQKWRSRIYKNGKEIIIGCFENREEAASAYNQKAEELYGEFAFKNEIKGDD